MSLAWRGDSGSLFCFLQELLQHAKTEMKLIVDLLSMQDPAKPHSLLTRVTVSVIILGISLVYAGFFGLIGAIAVYLLVVELLGVALQWALVPVGLALVVGLKNGVRGLVDYWRNFGRG